MTLNVKDSNKQIPVVGRFSEFGTYHICRITDEAPKRVSVKKKERRKKEGWRGREERKKRMKWEGWGSD